MDAFHFAVAVSPLAVYFILIATIRLRPHPFVTTGGRDVAALAVGLMGLAAIGPMELFFPQQASASLGSWVWVLLLIFYWLCVILWCLTSQRRLVVYGLSDSDLKRMLHDVASTLDPDANWVGDSLFIPHLGVHAAVEMSGARSVGQILSVGEKQSIEGWWKLELAMVKHARQLKNNYRSIGYVLLLSGGVLLTLSSWMLLQDLDGSLQAMKGMLRW